MLSHDEAEDQYRADNRASNFSNPVSGPATSNIPSESLLTSTFFEDTFDQCPSYTQSKRPKETRSASTNPMIKKESSFGFMTPAFILTHWMPMMVSQAATTSFETTVQTSKRVHKAIFGDRHHRNKEAKTTKDKSLSPFSQIEEQLKQLEDIVKELEVALKDLDTLNPDEQNGADTNSSPSTLGQLLSAYQSLLTAIDSTLESLQKWIPFPIPSFLSQMTSSIAKNGMKILRYPLSSFSSKKASQERLAQLCKDATRLQEEIWLYKSQCSSVPSNSSETSNTIPVPPPPPPPPGPPPPAPSSSAEINFKTKPLPRSFSDEANLTSSSEYDSFTSHYPTRRLPNSTSTTSLRSMDTVGEFGNTARPCTPQSRHLKMKGPAAVPFSPDILAQGRRSLRNVTTRRTPSGAPILSPDNSRRRVSKKHRQIVTANDVVFEALLRKFESSHLRDEADSSDEQEECIHMVSVEAMNSQ